MSPLADNLASIEDEDLVRIHDRRETVSDDDGGFADRSIVDAFPDLSLILGVEARCRLVEDEDLRILDERASDADALALAARELEAALADDSFQAFLELTEELGYARLLDHFGELRIRDSGSISVEAECDVIPHRPIE